MVREGWQPGGGGDPQQARTRRPSKAGVVGPRLDLVAGELLARPGASTGRARQMEWSPRLVVGRRVPRGPGPAPPLSRCQRRICRPGQPLQLWHRADLSAAYPRHRAGGRRPADLMDVDGAAFAAFRDVRRRQPKKYAGRQRRLRLARRERCVLRACPGGGARRQYQPDPRGRAGIGRARMDRDPPQYRRRDDAGARPHAGQRAAARRGLPRPLLHRLHPGAALPDRRGGRAGEGRRLGRAHHRNQGRDNPHPRPRHGAAAHDADRVMVLAARRSRRAAPIGRSSSSPRASARSACPAAGSGFGYGSSAAIAEPPNAFPGPALPTASPTRRGWRSRPPASPIAS